MFKGDMSKPATSSVEPVGVGSGPVVVLLFFFSGVLGGVSEPNGSMGLEDVSD